MFGVLLSSFINGHQQCDIGCCHFRSGLLSASDGRVIRNKCYNHNSVSGKMLRALKCDLFSSPFSGFKGD